MRKAVFALIINDDEVICTTRPEDAKVAFGLPGGKVDGDETLLEALKRECAEEGVDISNCINFEVVQHEIIEDFSVFWYRILDVENVIKLTFFKEQYRNIQVVDKKIDEVANVGYGNYFVLKYKN